MGLANFRSVLRGSVFLKSFTWTLLYGVLSTVLLFIIGMYFALLLNRKMPGTNLIRGLLLMPWSIPVFVNAFLWLWLLNVQYGFINYILVTLHILPQPVHWTGGSVVAKASVLVAYIWRVFPFNMIVYLAAFQTIDPMYYEVADIEGANKIQQFFRITVSMLRNIITFTALLNFIWAFQEFTTIWIMTRGGPAGATNTLMTQVYTRSFMERNFGEAAAMGAAVDPVPDRVLRLLCPVSLHARGVLMMHMQRTATEPWRRKRLAVLPRERAPHRLRDRRVHPDLLDDLDVPEVVRGGLPVAAVLHPAPPLPGVLPGAVRAREPVLPVLPQQPDRRPRLPR